MQDRTLDESVVLPEIRGEMVKLRAASWEDFSTMDRIRAFSSSLTLVGKSEEAERAIVRSWIQRSLRWQKGVRTQEEGLQDAEARGVMAWSLFANDSQDADGDELIGMAFLVDIDAWAQSARIQVILGQDYRGRGYTRDVMPRVMTYGFAPRPAGLGLHRIWISTSSSNMRGHAVYKSLGFIESGTSRDALWDDSEAHYMDLHVFDMLVDEFDPIQSLATFGLHTIMDNPGVREALAQHERTQNIKKKNHEEQAVQLPPISGQRQTISGDDMVNQDEELPWWRKLGANRKRD
ncbi:GNAT family protein [Alloscardovia omnicolens]|uniref:GNAT family N-acetyltransferase n=1 Tax=Alloscardovia omnicolens TaxID=419015 RepID=UPI002550EE64|nr:GNAT family protein [Alloscardovia omnicolens]MDK6445444.1 GNAT family protein [Alloscardovia omnicolens]